MEPLRKGNKMFTEHILYSKPRGWNLTNGISFHLQQKQGGCHCDSHFHMKSWFIQDCWTVKWAKQDSNHSSRTPRPVLFLLRSRCSQWLHSFSFASISKPHNHKKLLFRFLQCCWKLMRWNIPPPSSLVAPGLWKLSWWRQETGQSNWEMTKSWGKMKPCVQRAVIYFCFYLNLIFGHNFSCLNKHSTEEPPSTPDADSSFVNILYHLQSAGGTHVFNVNFIHGLCMSTRFVISHLKCPPAQLSYLSFLPMFSTSVLCYCPGFPTLSHRRCEAGSAMGQCELRSLVYHLLAIITFREAFSSLKAWAWGSTFESLCEDCVESCKFSQSTNHRVNSPRNANSHCKGPLFIL